MASPEPRFRWKPGREKRQLATWLRWLVQKHHLTKARARNLYRRWCERLGV